MIYIFVDQPEFEKLLETVPKELVIYHADSWNSSDYSPDNKAGSFVVLYGNTMINIGFNKGNPGSITEYVLKSSDLVSKLQGVLMLTSEVYGASIKSLVYEKLLLDKMNTTYTKSRMYAALCNNDTDWQTANIGITCADLVKSMFLK